MPSSSTAGTLVAVHILDSAQGHAIQTWRFSDQETITIGRNDDNDIVVADPQVSRVHARLTCHRGAWTLSSVGRHGTLVNDRLVAEATLQHHSTFRLGPHGPLLRFDTVVRDQRRSETLDNVPVDMFSMLEIDQLRKQQEVQQITENALFQELQERSRRMKTAGPQAPTDP